ncbi:MAG: hypothetical protein H6563_13905 [Lewinellaceae bacterium]|nr:hypothetical protein [Lewinellaceae bacterium]
MRRFTVLFFFLVIAGSAFAQIPAGEESIAIATDRDIYIAGDIIWLSAWYSLDGKPATREFSKILLVELLDGENPVAQGKIPIQDGRASGALRIPEGIPSRNYQLRAYTNWQRNLPPEYYTTLELTIINPASPLPNPLLSWQTSADKKGAKAGETLEIRGLKDRYAPREKVSFSIACPDGPLDAAIAVVKRGTLEGRSPLQPASLPKEEAYGDLNPGRLPDIRDVSLSGILLDSASSQPIRDGLIYVSIVDKDLQQLHIYRSGEDGTFVFPLDHLSGRQKVFISSKPLSDSVRHKILVNTDFSNRYATFPTVETAPDSSQRKVLEALYLDYQLQKKYTAVRPDSARFPRPISAYFAQPTVSVTLSDFIPLPTMEEVFKEIVPFVSVKKKKKHFALWVLNKEETKFEEDPLVLIDNLPVFDLDALMQINPALVYRIDVINEPYILGSHNISSVILVKTTTSDFAGMRFPESTVFLNYQTRDIPLEFPQVKYDTPESRTSRTPDFRTVLYWDPRVVLDQTAKTVSFYTSDEESAYSIIIRGVDGEGDYYWREEEFEVLRN